MWQISGVMDKFETQFTDLDVQTSYMESTMSSTTATSTPQDQVDLLMQKVADEAGLEVQHELMGKSTSGVEANLEPVGTKEVVGEEDDALADR